MKAILIPIDNRPVTYLYPQLIARIAGIEVLVPPRQLMGSLSSDTSTEELSSWLTQTLTATEAEAALICADSIIYGGLIPSRRSDTTAGELQERIKIFGRLKKIAKKTRVYVQSSIMRISDNYDNTEEKEYWSKYGREIFAWSEALHRLSATPAGSEQNKLVTGELQRLEARVDPDVRKDYLDTRSRNFQLNRKLLDFAASGDIDFLVYSQDDSGQYGLNVLEKERLVTESTRRRLKNVLAYAGADEVLMTLIARWLLDLSPRRPVVAISYSPGDGGTITSRYEGQTIGDSVQLQLKAAGIESTNLTDSTTVADLHFVIHTAGDKQGDHILLPEQPDLRNLNTARSVGETLAHIESSAAPVVLCDVAYANGSDPLLVEKLLDQPHLLKKLWGYAGWNTTGNTLGSAIATAVARWFAEQKGATDTAAALLTEALYVRFADDWAYQTQVRKQLGNNLSSQHLAELMKPQLSRIEKALQFKPSDVALSLPWQRSFEVEIGIGPSLQPAQPPRSSL
jgi:hypothetical protein